MSNNKNHRDENDDTRNETSWGAVKGMFVEAKETLHGKSSNTASKEDKAVKFDVCKLDEDTKIKVLNYMYAEKKTSSTELCGYIMNLLVWAVNTVAVESWNSYVENVSGYSELMKQLREAVCIFSAFKNPDDYQSYVATLLDAQRILHDVLKKYIYEENSLPVLKKLCFREEKLPFPPLSPQYIPSENILQFLYYNRNYMDEEKNGVWTKIGALINGFNQSDSDGTPSLLAANRIFMDYNFYNADHNRDKDMVIKIYPLLKKITKLKIEKNVDVLCEIGAELYNCFPHYKKDAEPEKGYYLVEYSAELPIEIRKEFAIQDISIPCLFSYNPETSQKYFCIYRGGCSPA